MFDDVAGPMRFGRRKAIAGAAALALTATVSPLRTTGAQLFGDSETPSSLLGELLALVPAEAMASPSNAWVDFFLPGVTLDALWPRLELELAFTPNPHSLAFNTIPAADQPGDAPATPMAVEGLARRRLMLICGEFDHEPAHAAWTAFVCARRSGHLRVSSSDPERVGGGELHDGCRARHLWHVGVPLSPEGPHSRRCDDPALIDAMRSSAEDPMEVAAFRSIAGADTAALSMGRIRFGDELPTRSRRPARAGDRSEGIDQRNDEARAAVADELGPLPVITSMLAGSTPGVPWVDDRRGISPAATYVALIEPADPGDAGASWRSEAALRETFMFGMRRRTELLRSARRSRRANGLRASSSRRSAPGDDSVFLWNEDAPF